MSFNGFAHGSEFADELASLGDQSQYSISMEMPPDTASQCRKYPSIRDYYVKNARSKERPIQLQPGCNNFSTMQLGDDRIAFSESILSESYRLPVEEKMAIQSPSKGKTVHSRMRDYQDATKKVGQPEIDRLERVMKDKLFQRSYATSSPFQVRKAFKFFDRENSMRTSIEGFTRALEFLGFQFSEMQNLALFARYDPDFTGAIDYMLFITKAMFYSATEATFISKRATSAQGEVDLNHIPDFEEAELKRLQEQELKRLFTKVDRAKEGRINVADFELLLMSIGYHTTAKELNNCLKDLGVSDGGLISFDLFFDWWTSDVGACLLERKKK